ncbi:hypothetical protein CAL14_11310 [Bordetella genomosp. 9]|nr:hypothetical protein CAL14_11310 [Bordetella genomosp. 9]
MPVHNCAAYLPAALDALLRERGVALEIVAVNDGSSDESLSVLQDAARKDPRVVVLDQPQQGPSAARNAGLEQARGDWVAFADADDRLEPGTLAAWHRHAMVHELDVLIGNGYRFRSDPDPAAASPLLKRQPWDHVVSGREWIVHCARNEEWPHYVWLQFIRRQYIERNRLRFAPDLLHEDILWTLRLAMGGARMGFFARPAYGYRSNPASIVNSPSQEAIARRAHSYVHILKALVDAAQEPGTDAAVRRALLRHANVECAYFYQLLGKKLADAALRRNVADRFHDMRLWGPLWRGATGMRQYRRLLRCYLAVARARLA